MCQAGSGKRKRLPFENPPAIRSHGKPCCQATLKHGPNTRNTQSEIPCTKKLGIIDKQTPNMSVILVTMSNNQKNGYKAVGTW